MIDIVLGIVPEEDHGVLVVADRIGLVHITDLNGETGT